MLSRTLAVLFAITTTILGYLYLQERSWNAKRPVHITESTPSEEKVADVSHIQLVSTVIKGGVAHIRIRNNNPYPIRGISGTVDYYSPLKKSESPQYTHGLLVESLIMPGQEFEIETFDSRVPSLLTLHGARMPDEWFAILRFVDAERLSP
jgi:hypothetical protein